MYRTRTRAYQTDILTRKSARVGQKSAYKSALRQSVCRARVGEEVRVSPVEFSLTERSFLELHRVSKKTTMTFYAISSMHINRF